MLHHAARSVICTEVRLEQPPNAELPMLVTLFPMVTEVRPEHLKNAYAPMLVTLLGITKSVISSPFRKR